MKVTIDEQTASKFVKTLTIKRLTELLFYADGKPVRNKLRHSDIKTGLENETWKSSITVKPAASETVHNYIVGSTNYHQAVHDTHASKVAKTRYRGGEFIRLKFLPIVCVAIAAETLEQDMVSTMTSIFAQPKVKKPKQNNFRQPRTKDIAEGNAFLAEIDETLRQSELSQKVLKVSEIDTTKSKRPAPNSTDGDVPTPPKTNASKRRKAKKTVRVM